MKSIFKVFLFSFLYLLVYLVQIFFSWWMLIFPCILIGFFFPKTSYRSFLLGFAVTFSCWAFSFIYFGFTSNGLMSDKISLIFHLPNNFLLFLLSCLIGGIVGAVSAIIGFYLKEFIDFKIANDNN